MPRAAVVRARYELCEDLAHHLVEQAQVPDLQAFQALVERLEHFIL